MCEIDSSELYTIPLVESRDAASTRVTEFRDQRSDFDKQGGYHYENGQNFPTKIKSAEWKKKRK